MEIKNRFPFFRKSKYVYLDSGATTQVPDIVIHGINQALEFRGNPNRSSHHVAERSLELLEKAKKPFLILLEQKKMKLSSLATPQNQ